MVVPSHLSRQPHSQTRWAPPQTLQVGTANLRLLGQWKAPSPQHCGRVPWLVHAWVVKERAQMLAPTPKPTALDASWWADRSKMMINVQNLKDFYKGLNQKRLSVNIGWFSYFKQAVERSRNKSRSCESSINNLDWHTCFYGKMSNGKKSVASCPPSSHFPV